MSNYRPTIDETLKFWESIIFHNEKTFMNVFCKNAWILTSVSWNSETMHFNYILECGQHVGDSVKMGKWYQFLKDLFTQYD